MARESEPKMIRNIVYYIIYILYIIFYVKHAANSCKYGTGPDDA